MKKADLFVIVMDDRLITKKVVYGTVLFEVESVTETCTFVETNEIENNYEIDIKDQYIKLRDYHKMMKEECYIYVGTVNIYE